MKPTEYITYYKGKSFVSMAEERKGGPNTKDPMLSHAPGPVHSTFTYGGVRLKKAPHTEPT